jgi:hypothetical protein
VSGIRWTSGGRSVWFDGGSTRVRPSEAQS